MAMTDDVAEAVEILEESTREERKEALSALKERSHAQPEVLIPHLDVICSFATDEDWDVRTDVAVILVNVARHDPSVVTARAGVVRTLLLDDDPGVVSFAAMAAMAIARESPAELSGNVDRFLDLLDHGDTKVTTEGSDTRMTAATTLGLIGITDAAIAAQADEPLAARLDDSSADVRRNAVTALARLGVAHPDAVPTGLARLPDRLDDPDPDVRRNTINVYLVFRHDQPAAIARPADVAPALKQAAEQAGPELDETEKKRIVETYGYIKDVLAADGDVTHD